MLAHNNHRVYWHTCSSGMVIIVIAGFLLQYSSDVGLIILPVQALSCFLPVFPSFFVGIEGSERSRILLGFVHLHLLCLQEVS